MLIKQKANIMEVLLTVTHVTESLTQVKISTTAYHSNDCLFPQKRNFQAWVSKDKCYTIFYGKDIPLFKGKLRKIPPPPTPPYLWWGRVCSSHNQTMRIKKTGWDGFSFRGIYYLKVLEQRPKETVFQFVNFESHFAMHSSFYVILN